MQDTTETFTSISACLKSLLLIRAFTEGKSASHIDLDGTCSTYANKFSTSSRKVRRSSMEEGGLRSLFPTSLSWFSSSLWKEVFFIFYFFSSNLGAQNIEIESWNWCSDFFFFFFFVWGPGLLLLKENWCCISWA